MTLPTPIRRVAVAEVDEVRGGVMPVASAAAEEEEREAERESREKEGLDGYSKKRSR
jgi:hypothetical protein